MRPIPQRRALILGGLASGATALAGCTSTRDVPLFGSMFGDQPRTAAGPVRAPDYAKVYSRMDGEQFPIGAFDYTRMDPAHLRANVAYMSSEPAGTIVVEPRGHALYLVETGGRATRYGVGVGREGFGWSGVAEINMRRAWPDWVPPKEMVDRDPEIYAQLSDTPRGRGVPGGPKNPLGARALYLFNADGDTGYRIHGTTEPETIGQDVSSGCVRMINQDVVHLYGRAAHGARVVVLG